MDDDGVGGRVWGQMLLAWSQDSGFSQLFSSIISSLVMGKIIPGVSHNLFSLAPSKLSLRI